MDATSKADRYTIRVGMPGADVTPESSEWGWSRTLEAARAKAAKLSRGIRSDCRVGIEAGGAVIEQSGAAPFFTGSARPTESR